MTLCKIHYTITDDLGSILDSSGGTPLAFTFGQNEIFPKIENEIKKLKIGESFSVRLSPEESYGTRNENLVKSVPKAKLNDKIPLQQGAQFIASEEQGDILYTVLEVNSDSITIDANHPLAGMHLNFEGTIVAK